MTMLGGGGNPEAWWELDGERTSHDATRSSSGVGRLAQGNDWLGVALATQVEPPADVWIAPLETISNSEAGFERVYQGSALLLSWPIRLDPGERWAASVSHEASIGDAAAVRGEVAAS
jgi:4-alpha-glucanotransferase